MPHLRRLLETSFIPVPRGEKALQQKVKSLRLARPAFGAWLKPGLIPGADLRGRLGISLGLSIALQLVAECLE
jgi:hypothetical protein